MVDFGEHDRWARRYRRRQVNGAGGEPSDYVEGGGDAGDLVEALRQADEQTASVWREFMEAHGGHRLGADDVRAMLRVSSYLRELAMRLALDD